MYKIFDTLADYNKFTDNGTHLTAGILYLVKENKSLYFLTNNIDGEAEKYEYLDEIPEGYIKPEGNIIITENGEEIDISTYATASVNVPIPEGYIKPTGNKTITQNGTNIDVNDYATATVDVAPNLTTQNITENGTYQPSGNYDGFSSVTVNVAGSGGNEDLINLIERDITSINIPSGTTRIGDYAFGFYTGLTTVTIPSSVTSIGNYAFRNCGLTSVTIPNSVTSIGDSVFQSCSGLTSVTIGSSVTSIGEYSFSQCTSLTNVTIGSSVTSIGRQAFYGCSSLTTVTIPSSVTTIDMNAFNNCTHLTSITVEATTPPTLGTSAFNNTNNCPIYVPAASVSAYKNASNWNSLASRIQAIPTA